jgi:hypothetical protein
MPPATRLMIRLSPELYAQLAARGRSGQPLAAIVRDALADYLARQPEQPRAATEQPEQPASSHEQPDALQEQLTALTTSLQALHTHVDALTLRVDALAALQQPEQPASSQSSHDSQRRPCWTPCPRSTPASSCSASCAPVDTSTTAPGRRSGACSAMCVPPVMSNEPAKRARRSEEGQHRGC